MTDQLEEWKKEAYDLGVEDAQVTASWVTDGDESDESRRRKLQGLEDGDPAVMDFLPIPPSLSGEMAGGLTPQSLAVQIVGVDLDQLADESDVIDELSEAYEEGVDETFYPACEAELRKWVESPGKE